MQGLEKREWKESELNLIRSYRLTRFSVSELLEEGQYRVRGVTRLMGLNPLLMPVG